MGIVIIVCVITAASFGLAQDLEFDCSVGICKASEYCFMAKQPCPTQPCLRLPNCVPSDNVCPGKSPYFDDTGAIKQCSESSECPSKSECIKSYCCMESALEIPKITKSEMVTPSTDDSIPDLFKEDLFGNKSDPPVPCTPCEIDPCLFKECAGVGEVRCIAGKCSCTSWFENSNGMPVVCGIPDKNWQPDVRDLFPSISTEATTKNPTSPFEVITLHTINTDNKSNDTLKYVLGGFGVIVLLALAAFAIYGIMRIKRRRRKAGGSNDTDEENERKVPLNELSPHNNNEIKHSKPLIDEHSNV